MNARTFSALGVVPLHAMLAMLAALVVLVAGTACTRRHDACGDASTTSAELAVPVWTAVPQPVPAPASAAAPPPTREPSAEPAPPEERPLAKIDNAPRPDWVPDAATLTVVEAPDLRRNLGIVATDAASVADAAP